MYLRMWKQQVMKQIIQKEFRNILSSTNIVSVNKSRTVIIRHVTRIVDLRHAYTILTINQQRKYTVFKAKVHMGG